MVFSKSRTVREPSGHTWDDTIIVVANLNPHQNESTWFHLNMPEIGLGWDDSFPAHDLITGATWHWSQHNWSWLGPGERAGPHRSRLAGTDMTYIDPASIGAPPRRRG